MLLCVQGFEVQDEGLGSCSRRREGEISEKLQPSLYILVSILSLDVCIRLWFSMCAVCLQYIEINKKNSSISATFFVGGKWTSLSTRNCSQSSLFNIPQGILNARKCKLEWRKKIKFIVKSPMSADASAAPFCG